MHFKLISKLYSLSGNSDLKTRAQQRGRLQPEIFQLSLKNVDESIESTNFSDRFCKLGKLMLDLGSQQMNANDMNCSFLLRPRC